MPRKKPRFTIDEHRDAGRRIKQARELLLSVSTDITRGYPRNSRAGKANRAIDKALTALMTTKHEMDEQVVLDFPDVTLKDFGDIYYGPSK